MTEKTSAEWGKVEKLDIIPPYTLVEEKAKVFNENFPKGQMRCTIKKDLNIVESDPFDVFVTSEEPQIVGKDTTIRLFIEVPSLNNYKIQILKVVCKISELYPCVIENTVSNNTYKCDTMDDFKAKLDEILVSPSISRTLSILRTQVLD